MSAFAPLAEAKRTSISVVDLCVHALALLWQIFACTGFPNHFFCDSWVVGFLEGPTMVRRTSDWRDELGRWLKPWLEAAKKRLHHNVLAIALANKLARIAWSVLAHGRTFEASKIQAA